ncbi:RNA polymerase sigma factor [Runella sp.]|uniref:RNA polymerase sigma factor n=1 Tax=Runella sp. TaxID=1960881 RepID=UPI003D0A483C
MAASQKEIELAKACQRNERHAQTAFYNLYKGRLMGICRRYARTGAEAEDIFQEAFIKIFQNIGALQNPESVEYWVKSAVVRTAIDYYRQHRREGEQVDYEAVLEDWSTSPTVYDKLTQEEVLAIINEMPNGYRIVANLYYIDGYTHPEIAQMLGIAEGTSKSQLARAREILKRKLKAMGLWAITL